MNFKILRRFLSNHSKPLWITITFLITVSSFSLILFLPLPRQPGLILRYDFTTAICFLLIVFFITYQLNNKIGIVASFFVTVSLFALPLSGIWQSGNSEPGLISGLIPYSDAGNYYFDALRLVQGLNFTSLATRRPLFPILFSALLWFTNKNLQFSLAALVLSTAISTALVAIGLMKSEGRYTAVLFTIIIFLYYRRFIGIPLTEHLGLTFGLLALILLLFGEKQNKPLYALTSIFLYSIAFNTRPGAMFILPALVIWVGIRFRTNSYFQWKWATFALICAASGFIINHVLFKLVAGNEAVLFSNFSFTFYGLASGGRGWTYIIKEHPEVINMGVKAQTREIYKLSFDLIRNNPFLMLEGFKNAWLSFFNISSKGSMLGFISGSDVYIYAANNSPSQSFYMLGRSSIFILGIVGVIFKCQNRKKTIFLVLALLGGIFLSVPFVPPWDADRMRAYAVTIPILAYYPAVGLQFLIQKIHIEKNISGSINTLIEKLTILYSCLLILIILSYPFGIKIFKTPSKHIIQSCPEGQFAYTVTIPKGSYIYLLPDTEISKTKIPKINQNRFISSVHNLPDFDLTLFLENLQVPQIITYTVSHEEGTGIWLFINTDKSFQPGIYQISGNWINNGVNVITPFFAEGVKEVERFD